jgi:Raf kinase inhibitor-like YbhB/YbcL family protein
VDGAEIPIIFTCTGSGQVPDIDWTGDGRGAAVFAVVVDDPDAPGGTFTHRVVVDLPSTSTHLGLTPPPGAHEANNSAGKPGWTPPCPPSGTHHYRFTVYGLRKATGLADGTSLDAALKAITSGAVVQGRLTGLVTHSQRST